MVVVGVLAMAIVELGVVVAKMMVASPLIAMMESKQTQVQETLLHLMAAQTCFHVQVSWHVMEKALEVA
jgi:hypothetical protein